MSTSTTPPSGAGFVLGTGSKSPADNIGGRTKKVGNQVRTQAPQKETVASTPPVKTLGALLRKYSAVLNGAQTVLDLCKSRDLTSRMIEFIINRHFNIISSLKCMRDEGNQLPDSEEYQKGVGKTILSDLYKQYKNIVVLTGIRLDDILTELSGSAGKNNVTTGLVEEFHKIQENHIKAMESMNTLREELDPTKDADIINQLLAQEVDAQHQIVEKLLLCLESRIKLEKENFPLLHKYLMTMLIVVIDVGGNVAETRKNLSTNEQQCKEHQKILQSAMTQYHVVKSDLPILSILFNSEKPSDDTALSMVKVLETTLKQLVEIISSDLEKIDEQLDVYASWRSKFKISKPPCRQPATVRSKQKHKTKPRTPPNNTVSPEPEEPLTSQSPLRSNPLLLESPSNEVTLQPHTPTNTDSVKQRGKRTLKMLNDYVNNMEQWIKRANNTSQLEGKLPDPSGMEEMCLNFVSDAERNAAQCHGHDTLLDLEKDLSARANDLRAKAKKMRIALTLKTPPTQKNLQYLLDENVVFAEEKQHQLPSDTSRTTGKKQPPSDSVWERKFSVADTNVPYCVLHVHNGGKGSAHLKIHEQRNLGLSAQKEIRSAGNDMHIWRKPVDLEFAKKYLPEAF